MRIELARPEVVREYLDARAALREALEAGAKLDVRAFEPERDPERRIAIFDLAGYMRKDGLGGLAKMMGLKPGGTDELRRAILGASNDDGVVGIMLRVDSPGGRVDGTDELAGAVALAASRKPLHVHVSGTMASAAYWVGSQAHRITASRTSLVGSIGVMTAIVDDSEALTREGIKVIPITSGGVKGAGMPGVPVSDDVIAMTQEIVDKTAALFVDAIAAGRGLGKKEARKLADGREFIAADAQEIGLIDAVGTFDDAMAGLLEAIADRSRGRQRRARAALAVAAAQNS